MWGRAREASRARARCSPRHPVEAFAVWGQRGPGSRGVREGRGAAPHAVSVTGWAVTDGPLQATGLSGNPGLERASLPKKMCLPPKCNDFLQGKEALAEFSPSVELTRAKTLRLNTLKTAQPFGVTWSLAAGNLFPSRCCKPVQLVVMVTRRRVGAAAARMLLAI